MAKQYICSRCGMQMSKPKRKARSDGGCLIMGLLLLITLPTIILPIIIVIADYMWYRGSIKKMCCPYCGGQECVIPVSTPVGQKLVRGFTERAQARAVTEKAQPSSAGKIVYDPETHQYVKR